MGRRVVFVARSVWCRRRWARVLFPERPALWCACPSQKGQPLLPPLPALFPPRAMPLQGERARQTARCAFPRQWRGEAGAGGGGGCESFRNQGQADTAPPGLVLCVGLTPHVGLSEPPSPWAGAGLGGGPSVTPGRGLTAQDGAGGGREGPGHGCRGGKDGVLVQAA